MSRKAKVLVVLAALACATVLIGLKWFLRARNTAASSACINGLRQIDSAVQQWALEKGKKDTDAPDAPALLAYFKGGMMPVCPGGGTYTLGRTVADNPRCSIPEQNFDHEEVLVVDERGQPIVGASVVVQISQDKTRSD